MFIIICIVWRFQGMCRCVTAPRARLRSLSMCTGVPFCTAMHLYVIVIGTCLKAFTSTDILAAYRLPLTAYHFPRDMLCHKEHANLYLVRATISIFPSNFVVTTPVHTIDCKRLRISSPLAISETAAAIHLHRTLLCTSRKNRKGSLCKRSSAHRV